MKKINNYTCPVLLNRIKLIAFKKTNHIYLYHVSYHLTYTSIYYCNTLSKDYGGFDLDSDENVRVKNMNELYHEKI